MTDSEDYDEDEEEAGEGDFQSPVARAFAPYSDLVLQKVGSERRRGAPPARVVCGLTRPGRLWIWGARRAQLINLMSHAQKRYVMEQAIDTIAAISEVAGHTFAKVRRARC